MLEERLKSWPFVSRAPHIWLSLFLLGQLLSGMRRVTAPIRERCEEEPLKVKFEAPAKRPESDEIDTFI